MNLIQFAIAALFVSTTLSSIMAAAWYAQQKTGNSGWVDVTWSFGVGGVASVAAVLPLDTIGRTGGRSRSRFLRRHGAAAGPSHCKTHSCCDNDPRYRDLIAQWGSDARHRMFWFLQSQAGIGIILDFNLAAAHNPNPDLRIQDLIGLVTLTVAIVGEASPTISYEHSRKSTPTGTLCATLAFGDGHVIRIISSSGCRGWPTRSLRSILQAITRSDGSR